MIGSRSFSSLKRKKDKVTETRKSVRVRMRLSARLYLAFREAYSKQSTVLLTNTTNNAGDMYRREVITILGEAVNSLSEKEKLDGVHSVTDQKSGLKISVLNLLKLTSQFLIGYYLTKNEDTRSKQVSDFLQVLKLYEQELFGDAYYELNFRRNSTLRKPLQLPNNDDVKRFTKNVNQL